MDFAVNENAQVFFKIPMTPEKDSAMESFDFSLLSHKSLCKLTLFFLKGEGRNHAHLDCPKLRELSFFAYWQERLWISTDFSSLNPKCVIKNS